MSRKLSVSVRSESRRLSADDDRGRVVRIADDAEIQRVLRVDDAHLGPLRGGPPLEGTALHEAGRQPRVLVGRVGQHVAVDNRRLPDAQRERDRGAGGGECAGLEGGERLRAGLLRLGVAVAVAAGRLRGRPRRQSGGQNHDGDGAADAEPVLEIAHELRAFDRRNVNSSRLRRLPEPDRLRLPVPCAVGHRQSDLAGQRPERSVALTGPPRCEQHRGPPTWSRIES